MATRNCFAHIPMKSIEQHFTCPICLGKLHETCITSCGHRYCGKCIKEWVDRNNKCPCCNGHILSSGIIRDIGFDALIQSAYTAKSESEVAYFSTIINDHSENMPVQKNEAINSCLSPLEDVLRKHLRNTFSGFYEHYSELLTYFQSKQRTLELQSDLADVNGLREELRMRLNTSIANLATTLDKHLTEKFPSPSSLPVQLNVAFLFKNVEIQGVEIYSFDCIEEIKRKIVDCVAQTGDKLLSLNNDCKFVYFGPLSRKSLYEMQKIIANFDNGNVSDHHNIFVLPKEGCPLLQFPLHSNGVIAIYGTVAFESDKQKECFAKVFKEGVLQQVDYFKCETCKVNWICRSCMEVCHKDHKIMPYIAKHTPTWACCYCSKKTKCLL